MVKVLIVVLAFLTAWVLTLMKINRSKTDYLRNQVAQLEKIVHKLKLKYGQEEKGESEKGEG